MPIEPESETHDVQIDVPKKGTVSFMTPSGFSNPAPAKLKRALAATRYFLTSLVVMVTGTPLFTAHEASVICFGLGVVGLATGAVELATGVSNDAKT